MKALRFSIFFTLFLISTLYLPNTFAQDYTQWHLPDGAKARFGNGRPTEGIAFSPDGTRLAVGSKLGIWIYDSRTYKELALLIGHSGNITTIAFSPDSTRLASGSWDNTIRLWDVTTGQHLKTLEGHKWSLYSIAFSPDGQTLVSGGGDGTIRLWDVATGEHLKTLTEHKSEVSNDFEPTFDPFGEEGSNYTSVAFSPNGETLASRRRDGKIFFWDVTTGSRSRDEPIFFADIVTGWQIQPDLLDSSVSKVSFSPDGSMIAYGSGEIVVLLSVAIKGDFKILEGHVDTVSTIAVSHDGSTLASGSQDGTVLLWELSPTPPEPEKTPEDLNDDGAVNIQDLVLVASNFGKIGENDADVNGDGVVSIVDLVLVAEAIGNTAMAPSEDG